MGALKSAVKMKLFIFENIFRPRRHTGRTLFYLDFTSATPAIALILAASMVFPAQLNDQ